MACIRTRLNKKGEPSYQAIVRIAGQPELRETFKLKSDARAWADSMSTSARTSVTQMPDVKSYRKILAKDAITAYSESLTCAKSAKGMAPSVKRLIGEVSLGNITVSFMESYIYKARITNSQFGRPFSDVTISKHMVLLRGAIRHAASKHRVNPDISPFDISKIEGKWEVERDRILGTDDEIKIRSAFPSRRYSVHWELLFDLAIETAARQAELVMMDRSEINLVARTWTIPAHRTKGNYERSIPLSIKATEIVKKLFEILNAHNAKMQNIDPLSIAATRPFFVFSNASSVCSGFKKLVKYANVVDFRFHDLRHTAVTRLLLFKRELTVYDIMLIVGHKTLKMLNVYAKIRGEDLVERIR